MTLIQNEATNKEPVIQELRNCIEHRATWFSLMMEEMEKAGVDAESAGRKAIRRCGCFHGQEKVRRNCENPEDMRDFFDAFADENTRKIFEMEIIACEKDHLHLDFHYCPLVAAWEKLGISGERLEMLCDVAMEGDRGIAEQFSGYVFRLDGVIAGGQPVCKIRFDKE